MEMWLGRRMIGCSFLMFVFLFPGALDTRSRFNIAFFNSSLVLSIAIAKISRWLIGCVLWICSNVGSFVLNLSGHFFVWPGSLDICKEILYFYPRYSIVHLGLDPQLRWQGLGFFPLTLN